MMTKFEELKEDRDRWRHLAQHLCFKAGHGPRPLAGGDGTQCGRCEGKTNKFGKPEKEREA